MKNEELLRQMLGRVVLCADGDRRRLTKIEDRLLYYEVPIAGGGWLQLPGTTRTQVEPDFIGGKVMEHE